MLDEVLKEITDVIELFICLMVLIYFIFNSGSLGLAFKRFLKFLKNRFELKDVSDISNINQSKQDLSIILGINKTQAVSIDLTECVKNGKEACEGFKILEMEEIETLEKGNKLCNCTKGCKINSACKKGVQQKCTINCKCKSVCSNS